MTALFILIDAVPWTKGVFRWVIWLGCCLFFKQMDVANYPANSAEKRM
jgi:hypothetical protein